MTGPRLAAIGLAALLAAAPALRAAAPAGPRPAPVADPDDPERCVACHDRQVEAWRASPHAKAAATEGFFASLHRFGAPATAVASRCLGCHTPAAHDPAAAAGRLIAGEPAPGVTCVACHGGSPTAHPVRSLAGETAAPAEACARCHRWQPPAVACSTVYDGWQESPAAAAGVSCQQCHMPGGSHRFEGSRSPAMLRRAATVRMTAGTDADGPVAIVEVHNLAGHRVPDG
ncbi:MAG TPA: multiheme c-type cytochrome [Thermodesulfobacteriota bacterium]